MASYPEWRDSTFFQAIFWCGILIFAFALLQNYITYLYLSQILDTVGASQLGTQQNVFFSWLKYYLST